MGPPDPFNRGTPRGSMYGYLTAARARDYERAAEYLDLRRLPLDQQERGPELARRLKVVLDQTMWVDVGNLSDSNAGTPNIILFLLDDLSSELDRVRTQRLVALLADLGAQVIATTTDVEHVRALPGSETLELSVAGGVITPADTA